MGLLCVHHASEDVPAQLVGAEPVFRRRRFQPVDGVDGVIALRRDQVGENAGEQQQQADQRAHRAQRPFPAQAGAERQGFGQGLAAFGGSD